MTDNMNNPFRNKRTAVLAVLTSATCVLAGQGAHAGGTILHYELEGEPGSFPEQIFDTSGNERHGSVRDDPFFVPDDPGDGETSLEFSQDMLAFEPIPELSALAESGDVTIEAIVRLSRADLFQFIVANWRNPGFQFVLGIEQDEFVVAFSDGIAAHVDSIRVPIPCSTKWYHLAAVRDSAAGEMRLYVDGELAGVGPLAFELSDRDDAFSIGRRHEASFPFFGRIAEVRVSNAALRPEAFLAAEVSCCPADLDGSGAVDFADILAILSAWGDVGGPEDLDGSGTVDFGDILDVLSAWGPCE